jgi:Leucine-rich repeat (LRR) protein
MQVRYFKRQQLLVRELSSLDIHVRTVPGETDPLSSWLLDGEHYRVREIELPNAPIDNKLTRVAELPGLQLESVSIGDGSYPRPRLGISGIEALAKFDTLTSLSLLFADITDEALQHLDRLRSLESLSLPGSIRDDNLAEIPVLGSLESLYLNYAYVTDASIEHLTKHPKLTRVNLEYTAVTDEGIARLQNALQSFHTSQVTGNPFNKQHDMDGFAERVKAFESEEQRLIAVSSPHFHDVDCQLLSKLDGIEDISFYGTWVTGSALAYVTTPETLKALSLEGCPLNAEGFEQVKRFKELRSLNLIGTGLDTETAIDLMRHLPKLEKLELTNCPVGNSIIPTIMWLPMLTEVWLEGTNIELRQHEIERLYEQKPDLLLVL